MLRERAIRYVARRLAPTLDLIEDVEGRRIWIRDSTVAAAGGPFTMVGNGDQNYEESRRIYLRDLYGRRDRIQAVLDRIRREPDIPMDVFAQNSYGGTVRGKPVTRRVRFIAYSADRGIAIHWRDDRGRYGRSTAAGFFAFMGGREHRISTLAGTVPEMPHDGPDAVKRHGNGNCRKRENHAVQDRPEG